MGTIVDTSKMAEDNNLIRDKKKSNTKKKKRRSDPKQSDEQQKRIELEKRIRKQVGFEKKAHEMAIMMIEQTVDIDTLQNACACIGPSHYQDVIDERAIALVCGYPICNNIIRNTVKQKYHISCRANKVLDITERKKFCSDHCFNASNFLAAQIPTSPVWARENDEVPVFNLLARESKGYSGESVLQNPRNQLKSEVQLLEKGKRSNTLLEKETSLTSNKLGEEEGMINLDDFMASLKLSKKQSVQNDVMNDIDSEKSQLSSHAKYLEKDQINSIQSKNHTERQPDETGTGSHHANEQMTYEEVQKQVAESMDIHDHVKFSVNDPSEDIGEVQDGFPSSISQTLRGVTDIAPNRNLYSNIEPRCVNPITDEKAKILAEVASKRERIKSEIKLNTEKNEAECCDRVPHVNLLASYEMQDSHSLNCVIKKDTRRNAETQEQSLKLEDLSRRQILDTNAIHDRQQKSGIDNNGKVEDISSVITKTEKPIDGNVQMQGVVSESSGKMTENFKKLTTDSLNSKQSITKSNNTVMKSNDKIQSLERILPIELVRKTLFSWKTPQTVIYLTSKHREDISKLEFDMKYAELCHRIDKGEFEINEEETSSEIASDKETSKNNLSKIPDVAKLQQDERQNNLRITEFFKGSFTYNTADFGTSNELPDLKTPGQSNDDESDKRVLNPILPLVDGHSQIALRRRIVLDKLSHVIPGLLVSLHIDTQDIPRDLRQLVYTFNLDSRNIIMRPAEWSLIAYFMLRLLALNQPHLQLALQSNYSEIFLNTLTESLGISIIEINDIVDYMKSDVDSAKCNSEILD